MIKVDVSATIKQQSTIDSILTDAQKIFLSLAKNQEVHSIAWTSIDPAGFDPDMDKSEYHDAPDYAMFQLGGNAWEAHGVEEAHLFMQSISLKFTEWAITAANEMNTKARYQNTLKHTSMSVHSDYIDRVELVKHKIIMPAFSYTGNEPTLTFATQAAQASATSYFGR